MIATITLNPAIDIRYRMLDFQSNKVNRVLTVDRSAGGKGLNVSRVLESLGCNVICMGFLGGKNGEWITEKLGELSIENSFIQIQEETRLCIAISKIQSHEQTEILEPGPTINKLEIGRFLQKYEEVLDKAQYVVASGSIPKGLQTDFYKTLSVRANKKGKSFLLDTSGEALIEGVKGNPFLIKPNKFELCQLLKLKNPSISRMVSGMKGVCDQGVKHVLLSLDKEGAILVTKNRVLHAKIPSIQAVNTVGSGDSMVAGYTYAICNQFRIEDSLKWACASGMANAIEEQTGHINIQNVEKFVEMIEITEW
jgi:tagatose 6-phosphate kinase